MAKINKKKDANNNKTSFKKQLLGSVLNNTEYGISEDCSFLNNYKNNDIFGDKSEEVIYYKLALDIDGEKANTIIEEPKMYILNSGKDEIEIQSSIVEDQDLVVYEFPINLSTLDNILELNNGLYKAKYYITGKIKDKNGKLVINTGELKITSLKEKYIGII